MGLTTKAAQALKVAVADYDSGKELVTAINKVAGTPQAAVVPATFTWTAGGTPAEYTTPTGSVTIANSGTPTVVELQNMILELRANIVSLQATLHNLGLTT